MKFAESLIPTWAMSRAAPTLRRHFVMVLDAEPDSYGWQFIPIGAEIIEGWYAEQEYVRIFAYKEVL